MNRQQLEVKFIRLYGSEEKIETFFSPGRVNLIGEHIDYNGGHVFPTALTIGIYGLVRYNDTGSIRMNSINATNEVEVDLSKEILFDKKDEWGNYPKGVIKFLLENKLPVASCDILFYGDLPEEAGLSSSAAIEVLTGYILQYANQKDKINKIGLAKLCQQVENKFIGVNSGIMDQFCVAMGKKDSAILLNCENLEHEYVPFNLKDHTLVIINSNVKRELAASKYNERRGECDKALEIIREKHPVENLCSASLHDLEDLNDDILRRRARHVITEEHRVLEAVKHLKENKLTAFGRLMNASHQSLKNDYEVTGKHLDVISEESIKIKGCIGSRMTGAGFGGCAIALIENKEVEYFQKTLAEIYKKQTGIEPTFYISKSGDGVKCLT